MAPSCTYAYLTRQGPAFRAVLVLDLVAGSKCICKQIIVAKELVLSIPIANTARSNFFHMHVLM